jgi:hypothetical protein
MKLFVALALTAIAYLVMYLTLTAMGLEKEPAGAVAGLANALILPIHEELKKGSWERRLWQVRSYFINWPIATVYATAASVAALSATSILTLLILFSSLTSSILRVPQSMALFVILSVSFAFNLAQAGIGFLVGRRVEGNGALAVAATAALLTIYSHYGAGFIIGTTPEQDAVLVEALSELEGVGWLAPDRLDEWLIGWIVPASFTFAWMLIGYLAGARGRDNAFFRYAFRRVPEDTAGAIAQLVAGEAQRTCGPRPVPSSSRVGPLRAGPTSRHAVAFFIGGLALALGLLGVALIGEGDRALEIGVFAIILWACGALAVLAVDQLPSGRWESIDAQAVADHPINNVPISIWILLCVPIAVPLVGAFMLGVTLYDPILELAGRVLAKEPNLSDVKLWLTIVTLLLTEGGIKVLGLPFAVLLTLATFVASLVALHLRSSWFQSLYVAGLLLNVILLHAADLSSQLTERLAADQFDAASYGDIMVTLPVCVIYAVWLVRSRRLNLLLRHRVRPDDPLAKSCVDSPDVLRQRFIARTALAFVALPPASQKTLVRMVLDEITQRADAAGRKPSHT